MKLRFLFGPALFIFHLIFFCPALWACSVCFGDPQSPLSRGILAGVILLVTVVAFVLGAIALTAFTWARRAKKMSGLPPGSA